MRNSWRKHDDNLPYHLASSSLAGATAAGLDLGAGAAGFFLEKRATVLKVAGLEGVGADLDALVKPRGLPSISDTPIEAAREAIFREWVDEMGIGFRVELKLKFRNAN